MRFLVGIVGFTCIVGCAEDAPPVVAPKAESTEAPDVPTFCASKTKLCVPPEDFVEQLCADRYASVAPYLFQRHTPFLRFHVKARSIESINGFKGPTSSEPVSFAEEVLLLRAPSTAAASPKRPADEIYDVLRWNGTCAAVPKRELVRYLPGMPQAALVEFAKLDTTMRAALVRDAKVNKLHQTRITACQDKESSERCSLAEKALSEAIVAAVRLGLKLPMPRQRPGAGGAKASTLGPKSVGNNSSAPSKTSER